MTYVGAGIADNDFFDGQTLITVANSNLFWAKFTAQPVAAIPVPPAALGLVGALGLLAGLRRRG